MFVKTAGVTSQRILEAHKCTDEDYAEFYPTEENSVGLLAAIRADPKRDFFCLDWSEDSEPMNVYGYQEVEAEYSALEVLVVPCNYVNKEFGPIGDTIHETCHYDH